MKIPKGLKTKFDTLTLRAFNRIKSGEFSPPHDTYGLQLLKGKAQNERNLQELYRERATYELLQNADDAAATSVAFIASHDGLAFAHDGRWFTVDNFRSLAHGWSDKDPSECIGHKGLGFRSVLDITPSPYLVKVDAQQFLAIKFTWALNYNHIQQTLNQQPELRDDYIRWTRQGQPACPVMYIPGFAKKHNLGSAATVLDRLVRREYGTGFTTMFWFPSHDPDIDRKVLGELGPSPIQATATGLEFLLNVLENEVSVLMPFLASVRNVSVYDGARLVGRTRLTEAPREHGASEVTVQTEARGESHTVSFFQMRFSFPIPAEMKRLRETPKAVREMEEAKIALSVRLHEDEPVFDDRACFHVYFPTEEKTGLGFVVHGDFFVKPDRTRLMSAKYNEWLLKHVAERAAEDFLTLLLGRYRAKPTFAALSPSGVAATWAAQRLVSAFSGELGTRKEPFVPSRGRLLTRDQAVIPPRVDKGGFWDGHFGDHVGEVIPRKAGFLTPDDDDIRTRAFLRLAAVEPVEPAEVVRFVESCAGQTKPAKWWHECYTYMARDEKVSQWGHDQFVGRRLLPTADAGVVEVSADSGRVVCLPPGDDAGELHVPKCFARAFLFLEAGVAHALQEGEDTVRSWVLDRFRVARFEATDLFPRAIGAVTRGLLDGSYVADRATLMDAWAFMERITHRSRGIESPDFWRALGRFPLPADASPTLQSEGQMRLIPAFLAYWPESFVNNKCLTRVPGIRRADEQFLRDLFAESDAPRQQWEDFLEKAGVSSGPKLLSFRRIPVGAPELEFSFEGLGKWPTETFTGDRQRDENTAVVNALKKAKVLWQELVEQASDCQHQVPRVLGTLALLEGFTECVCTAEEEFARDDESWRGRLLGLVRAMPLESLQNLPEDTVFCRGGSAGGHTSSAGSHIKRQLQRLSWLPSTQGPASSSECFVRQSARRFISSGRTGEELGDMLLPYVVVKTLDDAARLERLGLQLLEDAASASAEALVRALDHLGNRLSSDWGAKEILCERAYWRLVRGAIQETYRRLNQSSTSFAFPAGIRFAIRSGEGPKFAELPLYYAEPGSPVERAFIDVLPLFDADRPYQKLFETAAIVRLEPGPGETLEEQFISGAGSQPLAAVQAGIVEKLAPYLLATLIARCDDPKHSDLVVRRLKEWFDVRTAPALEVSFTLATEPRMQRTVKFPHFYLQRQMEQRGGAIRERHYTLYIAADTAPLLHSLDGDALGEAIAPVFLDGSSGDFGSLFPRIVSRFNYARGERTRMEEFIHRQLGISQEALDMARAKIAGEVVEKPISPPPPPTPRSTTVTDARGMSEEERESVTKKVEDAFSNGAQDLSTVLVGAGPGERGATKEGNSHTGTQGDEPTPEQQLRGERGEEEIKRRLELPGGWAGLKLISDQRKLRCGYDFLCELEGRKIRVEVKTFTIGGRVIVTTEELREAAASRGDYYLLGVLDDGSPPTGWGTFSTRDPFADLISKGKLAIRAKLELPAGDVFDLSP